MLFYFKFLYCDCIYARFKYFALVNTTIATNYINENSAQSVYNATINKGKST